MATAAAGAGAMPTGGHFAGDSSVMVAVRVRPMNKREKDLKSTAIVNVVPPTGLHLLDNPGTAQVSKGLRLLLPRLSCGCRAWLAVGIERCAVNAFLLPCAHFGK
jgi:hypothetical protein